MTQHKTLNLLNRKKEEHNKYVKYLIPMNRDVHEELMSVDDLEEMLKLGSMKSIKSQQPSKSTSLIDIMFLFQSG